MRYCNFSHYSKYHVITFVLTFLSYACLHATRKAFSNVKPTLLEVWTPTFHNSTVPEIYPYDLWNKRHVFDSHGAAETFVGALDMVFMFSYALGLFLSGYVAERLNHRWVLSCGMMSSAIVVFIFGVVTEWLHFYSKAFYVVIWILNGLCQSTGWPTAVAIMGSWFGENKGLIFGIWSACASVGNIIGSVLSGSVVDIGYEYAFLLPSALLFSGGFVIACGVINSPHEIGFLDSIDYTTPIIENEEAPAQRNTEDYESIQTQSQTVEVQEPKKIGFVKALLIPGVVPYALAYAFLKLVNYAFFFWLPVYLNNRYGWSNSFSDELSSYYDFGGIIGGIIAGVITDFLWARSPITVGFLWVSVPVLYFYSESPADESINALLMWLTGFFIGGPANVISATVMADLGNQKGLAGNAEAFAIVTGIVDGTGSIGAGIGQILIPIIQMHFSWKAMFYFFMILDFLTTVCIFPVLLKDLKRKFCRSNTLLESENFG